MWRNAFQRVLSSAMPRSPSARRERMSWLRAAVSGTRSALGRSVDAGTGAVVALVGQGGQPQQRRGGVQRAEKAGGPGSADVVDRTGFDVRDGHRKAGGIADDLHVAAVGAVFAGVPQVIPMGLQDG